MPFLYKKTLVVGATSGIGKSLAERFVKEGSKVIVSGRRVDRLQEFVQQHGSDKASFEPLDLTKLSSIPDFVSKITANHPDLDCVFLNSGVQTVFEFNKPETVDFGRFQEELTTNFTSFVALTHAFTPFFLRQNHQTAFIYTSSSLGLIPLFRAPGYSATKAAMHSLALSLREQFQDTSIKFVEILPPAVQTELHDYMGPQGRNVGMPLDEFTDITYQRLAEGQEEILVKNAIPNVATILESMQQGFQTLTQRVKPH